MNILILEDEPLAAEALERMLADISTENKVVAALPSVEAATDWFRQHPSPDLILSDVQLQDGLCFSLFETLKMNTPVIFCTAYDQYAIRAFEVHSIDYLLKPILKDKLAHALNKLKNRTQTNPPVAYSEVLALMKSSSPDYKSRFMVRIGQRITAIPVADIAYFYSESKLSYIVTEEGKKFPIDPPLNEIEPQLDPKQFFRINRQLIARFDAIAEMHPYFKGRIKLKLKPDLPGEDIVVSAERTPDFKKWLDQ